MLSPDGWEVIKLKRKYLVVKDRGQKSAGTGQSGNKHALKHKMNQAQKKDLRVQPKKVRFVGANGKSRMVTLGE